jgi:hypothetical protein
MPIIRKRSAVSQVVLSAKGDRSVGWWESRSRLVVVVHMYLAPEATSSEYLHQFCYKNFSPESYWFDRQVRVTGARYTARDFLPLFEIPANQGGRDGCSEGREEPCGTMARRPNSDVLTTAELLLKEATGSRLAYLGQERITIPSEMS